MTDIDAIGRLRKALTNSLNSILKTLNDHATNPLQVADLEDFHKRLNSVVTNCQVYEGQAIALCKDDAGVLLQTNESEKIHDLHRVVKRKLLEIYALVKPPTTPNPIVNLPAVEVKLPRQELPSFDGKYTDWTSFHDLFRSMVHNNTKISPAQKLHYLKSAVQGEAADLLKSIDVTDANYQKSWDLLTARYDNKRKITLTHVTALLSQDALATESAYGLRKLLDTTTKHLDALSALGIATQGFDVLIVGLILDRLDSESRKQWQLQNPGSDYPAYADLKSYLEDRARALEDAGEKNIGARPASRPQQHFEKKPSFKPRTSSTCHTSAAGRCTLCSEAHVPFRCPEYNRLTVSDRRNHVRSQHLCYNCLGQGHPVLQCPSASTCKKCNGKHHTTLHVEKKNVSSDNAKKGDSSTSGTSDTTSSHHVGSVIGTILSTVLLKVKDASGKIYQCRALLDNGSELSFITESFVQLLGLKRSRSDLRITGIGGTDASRANGIVRLDLESNTSNFILPHELHILSKLSGYIPQAETQQDWSHLNGLQLADPEFSKPGRIDMLLGADVYCLLLKDKTIKFNGKPSIYDTHFGWVVSGSLKSSSGRKICFSHVSLVDIQNQLAAFWELEELQAKAILTPEETDCENHFATTHSRDSSGRYVVALPFKKTNLVLGGSKSQAIIRLQQVERRLARQQAHREQYCKFMDEYIALGHMEKISPTDRTEIPGQHFYLPHHHVIKESSTSTKLRVVFDGSAATSSRTSLNDVLMVGPRLQREIVDILIRFRCYKYVFIADIAKFFRQVLVREADRDFQRILWRRSTHEPIEEYRLNTVTYGTASAPYLASRALVQLADDSEDLPLAAQTVKKDFYVDDVMSGEHSEPAVLQLQQQLIQLLERGQFPLVKWVSNCAAVLKAVPEEHRETQIPLQLDSEDSVKALGLYWNPASDQFSFKVNLDRNVGQVTKRTLLSDTAKLYDPLGWLAPVVIKAKILFQSLWKRKLDWDDPLPDDLKDEWLRVRNGLFDLEELRIDRHIINNKDSKHQLHGFCDASELAYSAAIYVRSEDADGTIKTNLICSKTKVAPVKIVSIPKLELCSAVLMSKLLTRVSQTMDNIHIASYHAWTDSTVVLDWLDDLPGTWATFVANRVSEIQSHWPRQNWNHVPTLDNPADCATKGLSGRELLDFDLWWHGPSWLSKTPEHWPAPYQKQDSQQLMIERRKPRVLTLQIDQLDLMVRSSSLSRLQRVTAFCLRFIRNCQKPASSRQENSLKSSATRTADTKHRAPLTPLELDDALMMWVKLVQSTDFAMELDALKHQKPVSKKLASLQPFIDQHGVLRVGGRLSNSSLPFNHKHPALLPPKHHLTWLIVRREHERLLHGGGQLMLASISKRFWIVGGQKLVRKFVRSCVRCFRFKADTMSQQMGNLPLSRLEASRPFFRCGVDYGGPFNLTTLKGRGGKTFKSYIALFVCFATKAVHIELVTELTTEAFLLALKSFVSRRGRPIEIQSDNGTNFVGASNELKSLYELYNTEIHNHAVADLLAQDGIRWKFIPARAPHCGGLWEAGIKSAKHHMRRVIGDRRMTFQEMATTLHQIEACLNSRPISPQSSDPNDFRALPPGHFIIGEPLTSVPEPDVTQLPENRLSRYQLVQQQLQHFWKRWHSEYLSTLQQRTKWMEPEVNVKVGDLVLIKEDYIPPLQWIMGRVQELHPGTDGLTRVVTLKTATGELKRHICKICRLPTYSVEV